MKTTNGRIVLPKKKISRLISDGQSRPNRTYAIADVVVTFTPSWLQREVHVGSKISGDGERGRLY